MHASDLEALHAQLRALVVEINDDENVPERYDQTARGNLAEADYLALSNATSVVHRLMLWRRFPSVEEHASYFAKPAPTV